MSADPEADSLREAAAHRGFRLVKSRRRKPGGDFGRFGLTDPAGKELFGFGADGLAATAEEIAAYLRKGEASTWAQSARITPDKPPRRKPERAPDPPPQAEAERAAPARQPRRKTPQPEPEPEPPPAKLVIRAAGRKDAEAIAELLRSTGATVKPAEVAKRLQAVDATVLIAEQGAVIGCLAWAPLTTLQHGTIARITLIVVEEDHRRRGVGRALLDALDVSGCAAIEAMSDIEVENAHGFFHATGFTQTSYRFARDLA